MPVTIKSGLGVDVGVGDTVGMLVGVGVGDRAVVGVGLGTGTLLYTLTISAVSREGSENVILFPGATVKGRFWLFVFLTLVTVNGAVYVTLRFGTAARFQLSKVIADPY